MLPEPLLVDDAHWKQRMRAPLYLWVRFANGRTDRGVACTNLAGKHELYAWDVPTGELRRLTDRPHGTVFGSISPDGEWVYYLDDRAGGEAGHFVRVPWTGGDPEDATPTLPNYPALAYALDGETRLLALVVPEPAGYKGFVVPQEGGSREPRCVLESTAYVSAVRLDSGAAISVWMTSQTGSLRSGLKAVDVESGEVLHELWAGGEGSINPGVFSPVRGDERLLAEDDSSGAHRAFIWNAATGERTDLALGDLEGDVRAECWSPDGRAVVVCHYWRARQQLWLYDLNRGELSKLDHGPGVVSFPGLFSPQFTSEGDIGTMRQTSAGLPTPVLLDGTTGREKATLLEPAPIPACRPLRSFECQTTGGDTIQGWVAKPEGKGPYITILETHGGPTAVMLDIFSGVHQSWLDHGFAICSVNYRGSTTFGRAYERRIWGELGRWEVDDMAAARDWLVENRIARPDKIFLTGASYGGYLTLQALCTRPELWAGGMALVGIADWTQMYYESGDMLRGYQRGLFEGTPEEKPEQYAQSSPITHVERLDAPLLIIQGRNDIRCPAGQMESFVTKAHGLGKHVEIDWFDAGHGAFDSSVTIGWQERKLRFLYDCLGEN